MLSLLSSSRWRLSPSQPQNHPGEIYVFTTTGLCHKSLKFTILTLKSLSFEGFEIKNPEFFDYVCFHLRKGGNCKRAQTGLTQPCLALWALRLRSAHDIGFFRTSWTDSTFLFSAEITTVEQLPLPKPVSRAPVTEAFMAKNPTGK